MYYLIFTLPTIYGSRRTARREAEKGLTQSPEPLTETTVVLDASSMKETTPMFCQELLRVFLVENPVRGVEVHHARPEVGKEFRQAAESLGVGFLFQIVLTDLPSGNPQALREASERWIEHSGGFARVVKEAKSFDARDF